LFSLQQEASNCILGKCRIKFHPDGSVTTLSDGKLVTNEGCSSISGPSGMVIYYFIVMVDLFWDKNHHYAAKRELFWWTGLMEIQ
jgi:hypothetical protein